MRYVVATLVWILICVGARFVLSFERAYKMRLEDFGTELSPAAVWRIQIGDFVAQYGWILALLGLLASYAIVGGASEKESRE